MSTIAVAPPKPTSDIVLKRSGYATISGLYDDLLATGVREQMSTDPAEVRQYLRDGDIGTAYARHTADLRLVVALARNANAPKQEKLNADDFATRYTGGQMSPATVSHIRGAVALFMSAPESDLDGQCYMAARGGTGNLTKLAARCVRLGLPYSKRLQPWIDDARAAAPEPDPEGEGEGEPETTTPVDQGKALDNLRKAVRQCLKAGVAPDAVERIASETLSEAAQPVAA